MTVITLDHAGQEGLVGPEVSASIHVHCALDLLIGEVEKIFSAHHTGIVDQHVNGADLLLYPVGGLVDSLSLGHVHLVGVTFSASCFHQLLGFG